MLVVFTPQGSQMGSTNSCFHEAWAEPVWLMWQCKCNAVTHADICSCKHIMSIHKLLHTCTWARTDFLALYQSRNFSRIEELSSTCMPTCVIKSLIIWSIRIKFTAPASVFVFPFKPYFLCNRETIDLRGKWVVKEQELMTHAVQSMPPGLTWHYCRRPFLFQNRPISHLHTPVNQLTALIVVSSTF